jgi:transcriptional regulator with XRE-family HTH domain
MANTETPFQINLKIARKLKGWSQKGAAETIGIKRATLASYEEGRAQPLHQTMDRICTAYGITDLKSFISDSGYFLLKTSPEELHTRYKNLSGAARKAVDILLGLAC